MSRDRARRPARDLNPRISSRRHATAVRLRRRSRSVTGADRRPRLSIPSIRPRAVVRFLVLAAEVGSLVALARSPVLAASRVSVTGNQHLTRQQLIDRAGLGGRPPMLLLTTDQAEAQLRSDPYVHTVSVRATLPDQVDLEVAEWEPLAVLSRAGGRYLLNSAGGVLGPAGTVGPGTGPGQARVAVTWDAPGPVRVGQAVLPGRLIQDLDRMQAAFPSAYGLTISSFALDANQKLTALTGAGPRILFGQMATEEQIDSLDLKLASLKSLRAKVDLAGAKLDYINLENPAAVTTRAIPSPSPSPASALPTRKP